jgi:Protein of unknown function (DUF4239)
VQLLASWPTWALAALWLVICGACAVGARLLFRRMIPAGDRTRAGAIAGPLMPALGAVFALLAALSLAGVASELRATEDQVSGEAAAASRLAWSATSLGTDTARVHAALLTYLRATSANEWRSPDQRGDTETLDALAELERRTRTSAAAPGTSSPQATELLASLDELTTARRQRLADAHHDLPALYVAVVALAGLALIANSSALALDDGRRVAHLPAGLVAVVGLAIALLFALSGPFSGGFVVSHYPIDQIIVDLRAGEFQA